MSALLVGAACLLAGFFLGAAAVLGLVARVKQGAKRVRTPLGDLLEQAEEELARERHARVTWQRRALRRGWRPGQYRGNR